MDNPPSDGSGVASLAECAICFEPFGTNSTSRAPKTLLCHHCLCLACLKKMVCRNAIISFVICPFCRMITVLPEQGVQALKTDEETLRILSKEDHLQQAEREAVYNTMHSQGVGRLDWSPGSSVYSLDTDPTFSTQSSIFTVSDIVSPYSNGIRRASALWGGRYLQELQSTYVVEIPQRRALPLSQPPPSSSVENLRVWFAIGLIVSIIAVFFILVFLK